MLRVGRFWHLQAGELWPDGSDIWAGAQWTKGMGGQVQLGPLKTQVAGTLTRVPHSFI